MHWQKTQELVNILIKFSLKNSQILNGINLRRNCFSDNVLLPGNDIDRLYQPTTGTQLKV